MTAVIATLRLTAVRSTLAAISTALASLLAHETTAECRQAVKQSALPLSHSTSTLASLLTRSVPGMFVTYQAPKNPLSFFCFCGGGAC
jgi:hypothetical protein